jgi:hypothetical protein
MTNPIQHFPVLVIHGASFSGFAREALRCLATTHGGKISTAASAASA